MRFQFIVIASIFGVHTNVHADANPTLPIAAGRDVRGLTLKEALRLAVDNNLGIKLQEEGLSLSAAGVLGARASFEPVVRSRLGYSDSLAPPSSSLQGAAGDTVSTLGQDWSLTLAQRIRFGTRLSLDADGSRNRSTSGGAVQPLLYNANLSLAVQQPLLRGFSFDQSIVTQDILRAEFVDKRSMAEARLAIAQEIKRTEDRYWDLVQALQTYGVQVSSLQLAEQQLAITQKQIAAGILAPSDQIGAESAVAQRELGLLNSENRVQDAMDALRSVMNLPRDEWSDFLLPRDLPELEKRTIAEEDALKRALQFREELRQLDLDAELAALNQKAAKNSTRPELDLDVRYGLAGQSDRYARSLDQLRGLGARDWAVSLSLTWSPLGSAAEAEVRQARALANRTELLRERFLLELRMEIRAALRAMENAQRGVAASKRFRDLAQRSLDAERKRFLTGKSRGLEVSQREDALAHAQTEELSRKIGLQRAASALDLAMGQLLDSKGIQLSLKLRRGGTR